MQEINGTSHLKMGIAITTYSNEKTSATRIQIIRDSLTSLKMFKNNVEVIIVVDGSYNTDHKKLLDEFSGYFEIVYREKNGGISKAKNTCIKLLLAKNIDIGFLADDDVLYCENWHNAYATSILNTKIDHFVYLPPQIYQSVLKKTTHNNIPVIECTSGGIAGCFMTFTPKIIQQIGYFRIYPYVYGCEHRDFSYRCLKNRLVPNIYDIENSSNYLKLHPLSLESSSIIVDKGGLALNIEKKKEYLNKFQEYVECIE
ncbi:putative glycosyltransferase [Acanthamoeba polyphaga mimivirus]|uniref:Glycosyltransferase n=1 Tax=Acanthamoeba polyphaga mimivirus Kroon TaxID=3069720 RepID=A0A0G2Y8H3_9VIRU|nr:putative glycosyltransferase [Acanthamoeba polyphaga mimivirus]AKI80097.1 putative glycosyltransferase [Acanthamoeba polyphaga mimivirus Kroon]